MDLRVYHSEGGDHTTLRAQGLHWRLTAVSEDDGGLLHTSQDGTLGLMSTWTSEG